MAEIDLKPTKKVAEQAAKGLKLREKHGRGGTEVGLERARQLSERRELTPDIVKKMRAYFARHAVDKDAPRFGDAEQPSAGYIAWWLWGGDPGQAWVERTMKRLEKAG
ncbi:hypothetical protein IHQ68_03545 [Chelatococcus sambhunathii]|uniref:DNA-binding protein n=1 Tax=Chelatococcus sambhunathii TaxID=363953 RepID=A0ABU1DC57_9HYPH|nr:hypothetical protein [Chelatococcus sambhunathii]MDR4305697.1 hypothetical protein [Chelatococcus sambhunathii]